MKPEACAEKIKEALKKAGVGVVASLPDEHIAALIRAIAEDPDVRHVPLCREEEGVGICTGAYLGGKNTALLMQNGGLLNSCNALTTTALQFEIPMLLLVYYAGDIGDRGFTTVGRVTEPVLAGLGIRTYVLRRMDEIEERVGLIHRIGAGHSAAAANGNRFGWRWSVSYEPLRSSNHCVAEPR